MASEVIGEGVVVITADVSGAEKAHATAEKAAVASAKAQEKEHQKVTKAAEKAAKAQVAAAQKTQKAGEAAAKQTAAAWQSNLGKISGAGAALSSKLGSTFAGIAGTANAALKPILEVGASLGVVGGAAVGVVAVGAALAAGATAAKGLADAAVAAEARLVAMGMASEIPAASRVALKEYSTATAALTTNIDLLTVQLGGELAPSLTRVATLLTLATDNTTLLGNAASKTAFIMQALATGGTSVMAAQLGLNDAANEYLDTQSKQIAKDAAYAKAVKEVTTSLEEGLDARIATIDAQKKSAGLTAGLTAAANAEAETARQRNEALAANDAAIVSEEERRQGILRFVAAQRELVKLSEEAGAASAEIGPKITAWADEFADQAAPKAVESLASIRDAALDSAEQIAGSLTTVFGLVAERAAESSARVQEATNEARGNQKDVRKEISSLNKEMTAETEATRKAEIEGQLAGLEVARSTGKEKIKAAQAVSDDLRKRAYAAFVAEKVAGIGQVAIQTSIALMTALAQLGPIAGAFAAAGILAAGGTSAGVIASQKPPEFPMGRVPMGNSPDHGGGFIQPREAAAIPRNEEDRREIRRMNEGRGSSTTEVVVQIGRRDIARASGRGQVRVDPRAGKSRKGR